MRLTVFHSCGKLLSYKRLIMGLKPSQGNLNVALQRLFCHLPRIPVIHEDIGVFTVDEVKKTCYSSRETFENTC